MSLHDCLATLPGREREKEKKSKRERFDVERVQVYDSVAAVQVFPLPRAYIP